MKKVSRHIFLFLLLIVLILALAPRLFILAEVRETITAQISRSLHSSVTIQRMHWVWLPLPHLTLINTNTTGPQYNLSLPKTRIYPGWRFILGRTYKPAKIILENPKIRLTQKAFLPGETSGILMPEVTLSIRKGELEVEAPDEYMKILRQDSLTFSNIRGRLRLLPQKVEFDLQATAPFSKNLSLQGDFDIAEKSYRLSLDSPNLELHKSIEAFFEGSLAPVDSTAGLTGSITGRGLQHFEANLHGTLPCFTVKPLEEEILLTCGFADLKLIKSGPLMRLDINDLEIKDPQINLSGHIERKISALESGEQTLTAEPVWTLDITGSDLDLTAIRRKILTLWGDNRVVKIVSDIVREGRALSASYFFSGRTADFKKLDAMIIEADFLSAVIHIPRTELDLTHAGGPIRVKDSILTGNGLSAQLGNSFGRNAELLLGLKKKNRAFRLDIDIDADLAALPFILAQLVKHEDFQRELDKFKETSGRASGTVHLGDRLEKIMARVDVKNMQLATRYEPIPQTIIIDSGALQLEPGRLGWQKAAGRIGQQEITSTSGSASWQAGETLLHIEEMQGRLEGASLQAMLLQKNVLPQKIKNVLSTLDGSIEVSRGSLQGPAMKPESWRYDLAITSGNLSVASPLLPEPAKIEKLAVVINHEAATIEEAAIRFLDQRVNLEGVLQHNLLQNWHGMLEFNGPVKAKLAAWVGSMGWFPEKLRPRIPYTMKNLKVNWEGETVAVSGTILHGLDGGGLPMAKIDFVNAPEHLRINELAFFAPGEEGRLALEFWRLSPHSLALSWDGLVNADTIDMLFRHSSFAAGTFSGTFEITYFADQPEATRFEGNLKAENLSLKSQSSKMVILIPNLDLKGIGRQLRVPALEITLGSEKITGSGQLAAEKEGLQLDISLASAFLSKQSLHDLSQALRETQNVSLQDGSDQSPGLAIARGWDITGRIGFDFDAFAIRREAATPYDDVHPVTYTLHDVHGDLQLAPDKISRTEIFSSKLCGLDFKGVWYSAENLGQELHLETSPAETVYLENVLPCLGVQQDIIEGEFTLHADLFKEKNLWYGGNIYIKSSQGRILRLKTLSRIFKVVNVTDLFEERVNSAGKRGFPFSQMDIDAHIDANNLFIDRTIIRGEGLNLFARGQIHLEGYDTDLTLLIAPFKTFDAIISKLPLIGQPLMGEDGSRLSIPVAIKGPAADPTITPMHPEAVGESILNLVKDTFMLPLNILKPLEQAGKIKRGEASDEK